MGEFGELPRSARRAAAVSSVVAVSLLCLGGASVAASPPARAAKVCHAPRLTGLTLSAARLRSRRAGCELRVRGAKLEQPRIQTVERQSPGSGRRASTVTVWLNPFCNGSAAYGPEIEEPAITPGPTELLSGFYVRGGPLSLFSDPGCRRPEPKSEAGTVEVTNAAGTLVATVSSMPGQLVEIPLPAGSYTIRGTFLDAEENSIRSTSSEPLVIPAGHTVRQDFFLDVP
jgi:hypothetical protein